MPIDVKTAKDTDKRDRIVKRIALESDRNEYEVLLEAVEQYLVAHKRPK